MPRNAEQWAFEIKFDGNRLLARVDGDDVRLFTRNGHDWTSRLKSLAAEIRALGLGCAWLDGEIVILSDKGTTDFQALQNAFDRSKVEDIQYFVFDLPFFHGHDLRQVPLAERCAPKLLVASKRPPYTWVNNGQHEAQHPARRSHDVSLS
ncbi:hypothetical protein [Cupriavidus sp. D39]|uniref:ATP-dependent DNA ligase n=1 Tax=Cupriavidus sp. D39 TaxID=2997877 RepID=UPI00226EB6B7|nr:hypothetical protein [Cupriavidus sp. D39]MCY0852749.1 hypothetical protein [Cupriavidus sp. D39]